MKIINSKFETSICYSCDDVFEITEILESYAGREAIYIEINKNEFQPNYIVNITFPVQPFKK